LQFQFFPESEFVITFELTIKSSRLSGFSASFRGISRLGYLLSWHCDDSN